MYCMSCGKKLPGDARFCYSCGAKIDVPPGDDSRDNSAEEALARLTPADYERFAEGLADALIAADPGIGSAADVTRLAELARRGDLTEALAAHALNVMDTLNRGSAPNKDALLRQLRIYEDIEALYFRYGERMKAAVASTDQAILANDLVLLANAGLEGILTEVLHAEAAVQQRISEHPSARRLLTENILAANILAALVMGLHIPPAGRAGLSFRLGEGVVDSAFLAANQRLERLQRQSSG